jgi:hypothetical protein
MMAMKAPSCSSTNKQPTDAGRSYQPHFGLQLLSQGFPKPYSRSEIRDTTTRLGNRARDGVIAGPLRIPHAKDTDRPVASSSSMMAGYAGCARRQAAMGRN